jgi:hypothetical protein
MLGSSFVRARVGCDIFLLQDQANTLSLSVSDFGSTKGPCYMGYDLVMALAAGSKGIRASYKSFPLSAQARRVHFSTSTLSLNKLVTSCGDRYILYLCCLDYCLQVPRQFATGTERPLFTLGKPDLLPASQCLRLLINFLGFHMLNHPLGRDDLPRLWHIPLPILQTRMPAPEILLKID